MFKRIVLSVVLAVAAVLVPTTASAASLQGTSEPDYTLCYFLPWLPSCKLMMK